MKMRKIVMVATLLAVVSGGELNAQAKTRMLGKISHVKVTKHKVTSHTTKYAHIKLTGLKHGETAKTKANKHGKFVIKVKKNNLKKLNFKIKATKKGYKTRTYKYKAVKKTAPIVERPEKKPVTEHVNLPKPIETPSITAPSAKPAPSKSTAQQIADLRLQLEQAKQEYTKLYITLTPGIQKYQNLNSKASDLSSNQTKARITLVKARLELDKVTPKDPKYAELKNAVQNAQADLNKANITYYEFADINKKQLEDYGKAQSKINAASNHVWDIAHQLAALQPDMPYEGDGSDLDFLSGPQPED